MSEYEEWRPVAGYPYEVSSFGRVRRTGKAKGAKVGRILKHVSVKDYPSVTLWPGDHHPGKQRYIHDLVCQTFIGPKPSPAHEVAHWDGTRTNCNSDNLRWATRKENMEDACRHATVRKGGDHYNAKLNETLVREIREGAATGVSHTQLSRRFGVSRSAIGKIVNAKTWAHVQ